MSSRGLRYRVGIAYPIKISGTDENGQQFKDRSVTQFIMRDGITLVTQRRLAAGSEIYVEVNRDTSRTGKVVGQSGFTKSGNVYAVAIAAEPKMLWGIHFPEVSETERLELSCVLGCSTCHAKSVVQLTVVEHEMLVASTSITRPCDGCRKHTTWKRVADGGAVAAGPAQDKPKENRRRNSRVPVKFWGYIVEGGNEDSVPIVDMSRDGIRFRSRLKYEPEQVVQVAVAYMAGTANIFVPGKVVWRSGEGDPEFVYGLRFMSRSPIM